MEDNKNREIKSNKEFLYQVGHRVRSIRASRGMSRRILANDSSISERYLANLELGKGNISISLLRKVAYALHTNIRDLLPTESIQTPEQNLIHEFINNLSREQQQIALQLLYREFTSVNGEAKRIALIGLRGAGKTTLGELLYTRQHIPFVKLTSEIEVIAGMNTSEILAFSGQTGYRRMEEKALIRALNHYESCCIETDNSITNGPKELTLLLTTCLVIWVQTTPEEHIARVIAQGNLQAVNDNNDTIEDIRRTLIERTPYYEKAHVVLNTSGKTATQSYHELVGLIQEYNSQTEDCTL